MKQQTTTETIANFDLAVPKKILALNDGSEMVCKEVCTTDAQDAHGTKGCIVSSIVDQDEQQKIKQGKLRSTERHSINGLQICALLPMVMIHHADV